MQLRELHRIDDNLAEPTKSIHEDGILLLTTVISMGLLRDAKK
jgi:hypothetical protein